jgi:hypothetical protein
MGWLLLLCLLYAVFWFASGHHLKAPSTPTDVLHKLSEWCAPLFLSSLAIGFVVMALIQLLKPLIRAGFHRRQIALWLRSRHDGRESYERSFEVDEFLSEISVRNQDALLALPLEQLTAQINATADTLIGLDQKNAYEFINAIVGETMNRSAAGQLVVRKLDSLQIQTRYAWHRLLRALSIFISIALLAIVAEIFDLWIGDWIGTAFFVLLLGMLGGFFASVARDIVAALEQMRR